MEHEDQQALLRLIATLRRCREFIEIRLISEGATS